MLASHQQFSRTVRIASAVVSLGILASCTADPSTIVGGRSTRAIVCNPDDPCNGVGAGSPGSDRIGVMGSMGSLLGDNNRPAEALQAASQAQQAGAGWVRLSIGWDTFQPNGPGTLDSYNLWRMDLVIQALNNQGVKVLIDLSGTPYWAEGCTPSGPVSTPPYLVCPDPKNAAPGPSYSGWFANYVGMLADHYDGNGGFGRVDYWEIYNEPDQSGAFIVAPGVGDTKAVVYADVVRAAAAALHQRGRKLVAPALGTSGSSYDSAFLDSVLVLAGPQIDVVSVHGYSSNPAGMSNIINAYLNNTHLGSMSQPVWATEVGYFNGTSSGTTDDMAQAKNLTGVFSNLLSQNGRWQKAFYFALDLLPPDPYHYPLGPYVNGDDALTLIKWNYLSQQTIRPAYYCLQALGLGRSVPSYCY
jgi:hypothetical protein